MSVHFFGGLDVAELVFYLFFAFFLGLIIYLRREDRREGYPLEEESNGRLLYAEGPLQTAPTKSFRLPHGLGTVTAPTKGREPVNVPNSQRTSVHPGNPIEPIGSGIGAGVGPGAYAQRADRPDLDFEGHARIVPISTAPGFTVSTRDPDPRGMKMAGADKMVAGTISDIWIDKADHLIRYLEVDLKDGGKALVPMAMCVVNKGLNAVICDALMASQFAGAPLPKTAGQITLLEEEQIVGYFGSGYLYATADRQEPII